MPVYPAQHHCNELGLTNLGGHVIRGMAQRHMIFDPDHMSVKARKASLDLVDQLKYPGVVSSHSWSTPDAYPRIYEEQGFITPYAGDSTGFVEKWKRAPRPGPTRRPTGASASAPTSTASAPRATRGRTPRPTTR